MGNSFHSLFTVKKIVAFLILLVGAGGAYIIATGGNTHKENETFLSVESMLAGENSQALSYTRSADVLHALEAQNTLRSSLKTEGVARPGNFTDTFIQSYLTSIAEKNEKNTNLKERITLPSQSSLEETLVGNISDAPFEATLFSEKDIRISQENNKEGVEKYIASIYEISEKNFNGFNSDVVAMVDAAINQRNTKPLQEYLSIASQEVHDLLALRVPSSLKLLHLEQLDLWQKKIEVFTAVMNLVDDPFKAALAIKEIRPLSEQTLILDKVLKNQLRS